MKTKLLLSAALMFGMYGCSDQGFTGEGTDVFVPEPASITGRVCHPSGSQWLSDALIYTNVFAHDESNPEAPPKVVEVNQTFSDRDGYWSLVDLEPDTEYTVYTQLGSQVLDQQTYFLRSGEDLVLPEPPCFDPQGMNIAVIAGDYDNMQDMLEQMGFINFTLIDGSDRAVLTNFLTDPSNLDPYDVVFFNGGHVEEDIFYTDDASNTTPADVSQVIEDYVWEGGSVIASDWSYDVIELVWPDAIDFLGEDSVPNAAQLGEYAIVDASVTDESLQSFIGKELVEIEYDLPVWPPIVEVSDTVSVHLRGNITYREGTQSSALEMAPLLVSFNGGAGRVGFSTFRVAANQSEDMRGTFQYMMYNATASQ